MKPTFKDILTVVIVAHIILLGVSAFWDPSSRPEKPKEKLIVKTIQLNPSRTIIADNTPSQPVQESPKEEPPPPPPPEKILEPLPIEEIVPIAPEPLPEPPLPEPPKPEPVKQEPPKPEPIKEEPPTPAPVKVEEKPKPVEKPKPQDKPKVVKKEQPPAPKKQPAPTPKKEVAKPKEAPKPKKVAEKPPAKKPAAPKPIAKAPTPSAPKKEEKPQPPLPDPAIEAARLAQQAKQKALLEKARSSISKINKGYDTSSVSMASDLNIKKIDSLTIDTITAVGQDSNLNHKEVGYIDELVGRLKLSLRLPEYGDVKVKLTLDRSGKVSKFEVVKFESEANKKYLEKKIPGLSFPSFGNNFSGAENYTFTITLSNEL
jgi:colicin import membrane protein